MGAAHVLVTMAMVRLIYVSRVARTVRFQDAERIAEGSAKRNARNGITGVLLYTPSHFIQVLEGDSSAVGETFERIHKDPRHTQVRILEQRMIEEREFEGWAMDVALGPAELRGDQLDAMDSSVALKLLRQLHRVA